MISRVWVPAQRHAHRWRVFTAPLALCAAAWLTATGLVTPASTLALLVPSALLVWTRRQHGFYAYGPATAFVWLAGQMLAIGAAPSFARFGATVLLCAILSLGWVPAFAPVDSVATGGVSARRVGAAFVGAAFLVGMSGALFGLVLEASAVPEQTALWPWVAAWTLAWAFWRQRPLETLAFAGGLAWAVWFGIGSGPISPSATSIGLLLAVGVRLTLDQGIRPLWLLALLPSAVALVVDGEFGFAALAGFMTSLPIISESINNRATLTAADAPFGRVRQALSRLTPYPRYYGLTKLKHDPLYTRLLQDGLLDGSVLDIGCGMALVAAAQGATAESRYHGLDLDPDKLRHGEQLLELTGASGTRLTYSRFPQWDEEGAFDRVFLLDMLHYWSLDEQRAMISAAAARLSEVGRLVVRDPIRGESGDHAVQNGERWTTLFGFNPPGTRRFLDRAEWLSLFEQVGLTLLSDEPCGEGNVLFVLRRSGDSHA